MMKLTIAFALLATASAINSCPSNSKQTKFPYTDMRSCTCNKGYQSYPYPGWGCYQMKESFTCPTHSKPRYGVVAPTKMTDCKCGEGWAPFKPEGAKAYSCVYAYVFHVHGRLWLQPFAAKDFGYKEEVDFQKAMGSVLGVPQGNILPYSVKDIADVKKDLTEARLGYAKMLLAENESGFISKAAGASIGFAVRIRGDSMQDGHDLANKMKNKQEVSAMLKKWKQLVKESAFTNVKFTSMFVWALTAEFWRPTATKKHNEKCEYNYECMKDFSNKLRPIKLACAYDHTTKDKRCRYPFSWSPKHPTKPPTPAPPTKAPTPLPAGVHYRASVSFTFNLKCECTNVQGPKNVATCLGQNGMLSYVDFHAGRRAALLDGAAKALGIRAEDMYIQSAVPVGVPLKDFRPIYNPTHGLKRGLVITLGFKVTGSTNALVELKAATARIASKNFNVALATEVSKVGWSLTGAAIKVDKESVKRETIANEHPTVTPAPTPVQLPGSSKYCASGAILSIDGKASFMSTTPMSDHEANEWFDSDARQCMVPQSTYTRAWSYLFPDPKNCISYLHITKYTKTRLPWFTEKVQGSKKTVTKFVYKYDVEFQLDAANANKVAMNKFAAAMVINKKGEVKPEFLKSVSKCTSGKSVVLPAFAAGDKTFPVAEKPRLLSYTFGTITDEYRNAAPTPAPTAKVDCEVTAWTAWTKCSHTCGPAGTRTRFRMVVTDGFGNGKRCRQTCEANGKTKEGFACMPLHVTESCNGATICPTDCEMGPWSAFGACSKTCGIGYKTRSRVVKTQPKNNGKKCPTLGGKVFTVDKHQCSEIEFCPVDCTLSNWGEWTSCSKRCDDGKGAGKRMRKRFVENTEMYGGKACERKDMVQEETCNVNKCPIDCVVSGWSAWGSCSKTCAGKAPGTRLFGARQERTRYIITPDKYGGRSCPVLTQTKLCALHPCGAHVCTTNKGFPLTCTFERGIVYTHHVNDVHDGELFMCYHNFVTEVCTCLCWPRNVVSTAAHSGATDISSFKMPAV